MDLSGKHMTAPEDLVPDLQNIVLKSTKGSIKSGNFSVKYESEKMNQTKLTSEQPTLSKYFSQPSSSLSSAASFFDQISSGNGSAMMTSVRESSSSQDLFAAAGSDKSTVSVANERSFQPYSPIPQPPARTSRTATKNTSLSETAIKLHTKEDSAVNKTEPVVCRIFASSETPSETNKPVSNEVFFDMLGGVTGGNRSSINISSQTADAANSSGTIRNDNRSVSVDFTSPEGSFLNPLDTSTGTLSNDTFTSLLNEEGVNKSSIYPSEADRRRDAWIPSENTRLALITAATSPPGTYFPEKSLLTMPGVVLEEELVDTVHGVVKYFLGEVEVAKRKVLTCNDVTQDERGLRELIQAGCYRAAVNLTGRLLTMYGQGVGRAGHPSKHTVNSLQLWFTRIALHVKLRTFSLAEVESEPFGNLDQPDLYFQFYPELYGGRMGSMVPFSFRLLVAELPQYLMKYQEALNRLHVLLAIVRKIISNLKAGLCEDGSPAELSVHDRNESKKLWVSREARVLYSIVNCALYQKDYSLAVEVLELLLLSHEWSSLQKIALQSALGRVYLQLGDVVGAERNFALARDIRQQQSGIGPAASNPPPDMRELIDRGLMAIAQNAFQEAFECFQKASKIDTGNIMLLNNMSVCLLYLGRLKESLALFEGAINSNPSRGLHESLLLNVCTLYELEGANSINKKLNMLKLLSKYKGDGVNLGCLKLQM